MAVKQRKGKEKTASRPEDQPQLEHEMAKPETKLQKLLVRAGAAGVMGLALVAVVMCGGHIGVAALLVTVTFGLFSELVNVGYSEVNRERQLPLYRSLQWAWFVVALAAAYGHDDGAFHAPLEFANHLRCLVPTLGPLLADFLQAKQYHDISVFTLYCGAFVATVLSLREGHYLTQIHVLSFTVLSLSLFVLQLKLAVVNVFVGMFWFLFPLLLVVANDTFAYFAGFFFGRTVVDRPLLKLSPNKTWEGFIGGGLATMAIGFVLPLALISPRLCCGYPDWVELGDRCPVPEHFLPSDALQGVRPVQLHGLALAAFASLVAPFGGFFASAIKRAYGFKDFSTLIPGHGGFMDRLDCQFLMASCTWVYLSTFIVVRPSTLEAALSALGGLSAADRTEALHYLEALVKAG